MPNTVTTDVLADVQSTTAWMAGGSVYVLPGVSTDLSVRFSAEELPIVIGEVQKIVGAPETCVVGAVLGGALEDSDLHFWENKALTAQTVCKTDIPYSAVLAALKEKDPDFARFLEAKRTAAKAATLASYDAQADKDRAKVFQKTAETAKKAAEGVADVAAAAKKGIENTLDMTPILIGVGLVAVVIVGAVLISRK